MTVHCTVYNVQLHHQSKHPFLYICINWFSRLFLLNFDILDHIKVSIYVKLIRFSCSNGGAIQIRNTFFLLNRTFNICENNPINTKARYVNWTFKVVNRSYIFIRISHFRRTLINCIAYFVMMTNVLYGIEKHQRYSLTSRCSTVFFSPIFKSHILFILIRFNA